MATKKKVAIRIKKTVAKAKSVATKKVQPKKSVVRNQHTDVLNYLKTHKRGITQMDAYKVFPAPITRLSAVIFDLRKMGYTIESVEETGKNCYGTTQYVRYVLIK